jgi:hypothetical protein
MSGWCHLLPQSDYIWDADGARTCSYVSQSQLAHGYSSMLKQQMNQCYSVAVIELLPDVVAM